MATDSSRIFIDSNILIYAAFEDLPQHSISKKIRDRAVEGKINACISTQVLSEYYSTITDSRKFNRPLSSNQAKEEVDKYFSSKLTLFAIKRSTLLRTFDLAEKYQIKRQKLYDTQIVATMIDNGVHDIYTFNEKDFAAFSEIKVTPF